MRWGLGGSAVRLSKVQAGPGEPEGCRRAAARRLGLLLNAAKAPGPARPAALDPARRRLSDLPAPRPSLPRRRRRGSCPGRGREGRPQPADGGVLAFGWGGKQVFSTTWHARGGAEPGPWPLQVTRAKEAAGGRALAGAKLARARVGARVWVPACGRTCVHLRARKRGWERGTACASRHFKRENVFSQLELCLGNY